MSKKVTTELFIERAMLIHSNNEYDYSNSIYRLSNEKISIKHNICGRFFDQLPLNHLKGSGCPHCYSRRTISKISFLKKAKLIHGDKYDYSKSIYKLNSDKIEIFCNYCNEYFFQELGRHLRGNGCVKCANNSRKKNKDDFINESKLVHGVKYNYDLTEYKDAKTKVIIKCNTCDLTFAQNPAGHLSGWGCPDCGKQLTGRTKTKFKNSCKRNNGYGSLYLIRCFNENESFFKIGITSTKISHRFSKCNMPYDYEIISIKKDDPSNTWDGEKNLHKKLRKYKYKPLIGFAGETECFSIISNDVFGFFGINENV